MIKKFIKEYKPHLKMFLAVLFSSITISLIDLFIPTLTSVIINNGIGDKQYDLFLKVAVFMIALYLIRVLLTYFVTLKGHMVGVSIEFGMRRKLFDKITSLPVKFFDNNSVGRLMARITNDLNEISEVAHHGPEDLAMVVILVIGSGIMMFRMNATLALVIVILIPLIVIINELSRKKFFETNLDLKIKLSDINSQTNDTFSGIRQVKAFANEEFELEKFDENNDRFYYSKEASYRVMASYFASLKGFFGILSLVVIIFGGYLVSQGQMNVGELTAFIMYVSLFQEPITKFANFITEYNKAASGFSRYLEIMELPAQSESKNAKEIGEVVGKIEFKNVWFRYDENSDYVLKDFNLVIKPGETLALVGESGAGKSTICNLINRYYEIEKGKILIDGINIKEFTLASLRHHIGLVSQDVFIFSGTLYDNIVYGDLTKDTKSVKKACENAKLESLVNELDYGYDSYIGERGVKLSGGQKQRLSLARVFLKNPSIMILDEATSALDNKTEKEIQGVIEKLSKNRTNIVVAHRLSTIENADKIVVVSKNGIEESGTHQELLDKKGQYYQLYNASLKI
ncbi:ATP-binding cassette subfamily B protein [Bacilli bacterium PM5-3]|nr:ATP-binding cassette subfamily B protein [Bacilli bacterium PM5-3]MDH6603831.1 ATP-binding cassette subfamily B protein [Bacilli bacterium PM5-9]